MDQDDERHLFDLIINPVIGGLTTIAVPIAILLSGIAILQGRFLFVIPLIILLLLAEFDLILFVLRIFSANRGRPRSEIYHRYAFRLLLLFSLSLSILVTLVSFWVGVFGF